MRHQRLSNNYHRTSNQRKSLRRGLLTALITSGQIKTTLSKAKLLSRSFDKLIFKARRKPELAKQILFDQIPNRLIVKKLIEEIIPNLPNSTGLTSLTKLDSRKGDNAKIVLIKIIGNEKTAEIIPEKSTKK